MAKYSYITDKSNSNRKIQVESAKRDGAGKNIENNYAKQNGYYSQLTAGFGENLTPYGENSGILDDAPFVFQTSGGTSDIGRTAQIKKLTGCSVAFNQLVQNGNFASTSGWSQSNATLTVSNNVGIISNIVARYAAIYRDVNTVKGHKYLVQAKIKSDSVDAQMFADERATGIPTIAHRFNSSGTNILSPVYAIVQATLDNAVLRVGYTDNRTSDWTDSQIADVNVFDLTQMFGSTIADYIYSLEQNQAGAGVSWFRQYFQELYYPYNTGSIVSSKIKGYKVVGFNAWDEVWEIGSIDNNGNNQSLTNRIRSKNFIRVLPNTTYYFKSINNGKILCYDANKNFIPTSEYTWTYAPSIDKNTTFTTPNNCVFIRFTIVAAYGTTYNHDICISLYWDGSKTGYEPYWSETYAFPKVELRGFPKLDADNHLSFDGDEYTSDGKIVRKRGSYTFTGNENIQTSTDGRFYWQGLSSVIKKTDDSSVANILIVGLEPHTKAAIHNYTNAVAVNSNGYVWFRLASDTTQAQMTTFLTGKTIEYDLANTTEENAQPYQANTLIDDWGTQEWLSDETIIIPQPAEFFYSVDYKAFVDSLGGREDIDYDAGKIVSQEQLTDVVEGRRPVSVSQLADNMTPYSEDSGDLQENPFISNGTGTNNNQEIVTVGDYALIQEKQGNSMVVNQFISLYAIQGSMSSGSTSVKNDDGSVTFNGTFVSSGNRTFSTSFRMFKHKYLTIIEFSGTISEELKVTYGYVLDKTISAGTYTNGRIIEVRTSNDELSGRMFGFINPSATQTFTNFTIRAQLVDLNQTFNNDQTIIADITANPSHFFWYYNGSLAYNTGSLESANGVKLVSTGRQLWDEQWDLGYIEGTGEPSQQVQYVRSKNLIRVIPNTTYHYKITATDYLEVFYYDKDGNFIEHTDWFRNQTRKTPINCNFIRFMTNGNYGSTYKHDITISLYYTPEQGGEGYDKYYPYEEPTIVDTGSEVLLSAGNARDYKEPSNVIHRVVGTVDLGTINWNYRNDNGDGTYTFRADDNSVNYKVVDAIDYSCSKFSCDHRYSSTAGFSANAPVNSIALYFSGSNTDKYIYVKTSINYADAAAFKTAMSGVYLYYELATETTEQGTPYPETLPINDYGMLYWLDTNNELVGIPQGAKIFFPVNYKGFVDDVYSRTSGDAENLVVQNELSASETARDTVDTQLLNAIGGTLRQLLSVKASLDFDNTAWLDFGDLSWIEYQDGIYYSSVVDTAKASAQCLTTLYKKVNAVENVLTTNLSCAFGGDKRFWIRDDTYTEATAFKNAMKGVLLAYEKA